MSIIYRKGDATKPVADDHKYILHIVNDAGGWGAGFVLAVSKRWKAPEKDYRQRHKSGELVLGSTFFVPVEDDITIVNMVAQQGHFYDNGPPIRYDALRTCLETVKKKIIHGSVHMPKIGTGLAGGSWDIIEPLLVETLSDIQKFVYLL